MKARNEEEVRRHEVRKCTVLPFGAKRRFSSFPLPDLTLRT